MRFINFQESFERFVSFENFIRELFFEADEEKTGISLIDIIKKVHAGEQIVIDGIVFKPDDSGIIGIIPKKRSSVEVEPLSGKKTRLTITTPEYSESFQNIFDLSDLKMAVRRAKVFNRHESHLSKMTAELSDEQYRALFPDSIQKSFNLIHSSTNLLGILKQVLPHRLPKNIGSLIGQGGEGQAFEYGNDKVIKIFIVDSFDTARIHLRTLERVKKRNIPCIVKVFDYGFIGRMLPPYKGLGRRTNVQNEAIYVFYYISERLMSFEPSDEQVQQVFKCLQSNNVSFDDVADNLMISADGQPKLIDIGRFIKVGK